MTLRTAAKAVLAGFAMFTLASFFPLLPSDAWPYLIVFAAMFALDFVWAVYTQACANGTALSASFYAVGIIVLSGTAQIGYVTDYWLLIPAAAGAFLGTFASLKTVARI